MDEIEWIQTLDRAKPDVAQVDVSRRVMLTLRSQHHQRDRIFPFAALLATAAGMAALAVALPAWIAAQDPLAGFADGFRMVLQ
ncbi:MAG: hypothetical protein H0T11_04720 [Chthoniobacterales bacterium]|nr:hypothetical protein [Chthoniobacterales bacterium]